MITVLRTVIGLALLSTSAGAATTPQDALPQMCCVADAMPQALTRRAEPPAARPLLIAGKMTDAECCLKGKLDHRDRDLFSKSEPKVSKKGIGASSSAPASLFLPLTTPLTPQEELSIEKSQALRLFELGDRYNTERELRNFLDRREGFPP